MDPNTCLPCVFSGNLPLTSSLTSPHVHVHLPQVSIHHCPEILQCFPDNHTLCGSLSRLIFPSLFSADLSPPHHYPVHLCYPLMVINLQRQRPKSQASLIFSRSNRQTSMCLSSHCLLSFRKLWFHNPSLQSLTGNYSQLLYLHSSYTVWPHSSIPFYQEASAAFWSIISSLLTFQCLHALQFIYYASKIFLLLLFLNISF